VKQAVPDVSSLSPSDVEGVSRVEVQVKINTNGRVTDALITNGSKLSEALSNAVLNAAKRWTFAPATRGGKPVASDHTIIFQFGAATPK
jgi:TonB family protein